MSSFLYLVQFVTVPMNRAGIVANRENYLISGDQQLGSDYLLTAGGVKIVYLLLLLIPLEPSTTA